ncbi:MAG: hypothetical protein IBJ11_03820 [Phycisphaerales bacterium]|nr:hypothetical protein [Phycisphaerales bacterium]
MDVRTTGRLLAAVTFTAVVGVVALAFWTSRRSPAPAPVAPLPPLPALAGGGSTPVDPTGTQSPIDLVAMGQRGSWLGVDPRTGRPSYELLWDTLDPEDAGRIRLARPRAWFDAGAGRTVLVTAESGRLVWPARDKEPESGELLGGVTARLLRPGTPRTVADDPRALEDATVGRLFTPTIRFESALGQVETTDRIAVSGPGLALEAVGLVLRFSEVQRRLQYARIDQGGTLTINPSRMREAAAPGDTPDDQASGAATATVAPPERIDLYQATIAGSRAGAPVISPLRIVQGRRTVEAEMLTVFARLADGSLPREAIAPFERTAPATVELMGPPAPGQSMTVAIAPPAASGLPDEEIRATWGGPLEVRPVGTEAPGSLRSERVKELARDDLAVRLASPRTGRVEVADPESGTSVRAAEIEYGATARSVALSARPGAAEPEVAVVIAQAGELLTTRLEADLTTGVGSAAGAGRFLAARQPAAADAGEPAPQPPAVRWTGRSDFRFDTSAGPVGAGGMVLPTELSFTDGVEASDRSGRLTAGFVRATLAAVARSDRVQPDIRLVGVLASDDARLTDAGDGTVRADQIRVAFDRASPTPRPVGAEARGGVVASQNNQNLRADRADVRFDPDPQGRGVRAGALNAEGGVRVLTADGVEALADRLSADVPARQAVLFGAPAELRRNEGGEARSLRAARINLDGDARRLTAPESGTIAFALTSDGRDLRTDVQWSGGLTFNDRDGIADLRGDVRLVGQSGSLERQSARGDQLTIRLAQPTPDGKRPVAEVRLDGAEAPASVEFRRFAAPAADAGTPPDAPRTLEALAALRSGRLILTNAPAAGPLAQRVEAPGPGTLVVEDRRGPAAPAPPPTANAPGTRGTSVFTWTGGLVVERASGVATMQGGVRLRHLAPGASAVTEIEADSARAEVTRAAEASDPDRPELRRVAATGNVYVKHEQTRISAAELAYDVASGVATATAAPGGVVTVFDGRDGRTVTAAAVEIEPATGRWRIAGAGTIGGSR